jgi:hypothetical protein
LHCVRDFAYGRYAALSKRCNDHCLVEVAFIVVDSAAAAAASICVDYYSSLVKLPPVFISTSINYLTLYTKTSISTAKFGSTRSSASPHNDNDDNDKHGVLEETTN